MIKKHNNNMSKAQPVKKILDEKNMYIVNKNQKKNEEICPKNSQRKNNIKKKYDFVSSDESELSEKNSDKNIILEIDNSDDDSNDNYQSALMTNLAILSNNNNSSDKSQIEEKKPTETRIEFVKQLLNGNKLKPMVDFDNCDTESIINTRMRKKIMDVKELFNSLNVKLSYLKSGTTGHTFKAVSKNNKSVAFAVKVCAYPIDDYGAINNSSRPENVELRILKLLSNYVIKLRTPHFVLPIATFNTNIIHFVNIPPSMIDLTKEKNDMYKKFVDRYNDGEFEDFVSVLINEWCNGGDLLDYIRKNYTTMTIKQWTVLLFQILYTLARIHQDFPAFRHNDMKANNILVQITDIKSQPNNRYRYTIDNVNFYIPNINLQIKIWDFDFACIDGIIENNKVNSDWTKRMNITKRENKYYDMHYFFNTLISKRFFPQFYENTPQQIIDFVHRIIPEKFRGVRQHIKKNGVKYKYGVNYDYVNRKGRIQVDTEFTTPYKVIMEDPLFEKYRFKSVPLGSKK